MHVNNECMHDVDPFIDTFSKHIETLLIAVAMMTEISSQISYL